jgi:hypothetical protein
MLISLVIGVTMGLGAGAVGMFLFMSKRIIKNFNRLM